MHRRQNKWPHGVSTTSFAAHAQIGHIKLNFNKSARSKNMSVSNKSLHDDDASEADDDDDEDDDVNADVMMICDELQ